MSPNTPSTASSAKSWYSRGNKKFRYIIELVCGDKGRRGLILEMSHRLRDLVVFSKNPKVATFLLLAVSSNAFGVLLPILLATALPRSSFGEFSLGALSGSIGFAVSSYGFENTLLRISASSQSRIQIASSWLIRISILSIFCVLAYLLIPSKITVIAGVWTASACLFNRGAYDYQNRQLEFIVHILLDRLLAIFLVLALIFKLVDDVTSVLLGLFVIRLSIAIYSSKDVFKAASQIYNAWSALKVLLKQNSFQAITATVLAAISAGAPIMLGHILSKEATAKYYFVYQFGYLTPVIYGYLSRYLYVHMYGDSYSFKNSRKKIRLQLTAMWAFCSSGVLACYFLAQRSGVFLPGYFDYSLLLIFIIWNFVFIHGAYLSAYLLSLHQDLSILKINLIAIPILAILTFTFVELFGVHGAALAMVATHSCVILMYRFEVNLCEKNRKANS